MGARHQAGLAGKQSFEVLGEELGGVLGCWLPPLDDKLLTLREVDPRCNIGLVVNRGKNELIPGLEMQCGRDIAKELCSGRAQDCS